MKKIIVYVIGVVVAGFLTCTPVHHPQKSIGEHPKPFIELVESIPSETILDQPDIRNTAEVWLEMIGNARQSLDLEQFYLVSRPGEPLDTVLQAIGQAAGRGVRVRILVDSRMYKTYPQLPDSLAKIRNIEVRIIDFVRMTGGVQHAKYFIVDDQEVFVGSQNFDWRALTQIHETGLRIRHAGVTAYFKRLFELDWAMAERNEVAMLDSFLKPQYFPAPVVVVDPYLDTVLLTPTASPIGWLPDSNTWDETHILRLIHAAKHHLRLQFMLYGTYDRKGGSYRVLEEALLRAAERGVQVQLMVADWILGRPAEKDLQKLMNTSGIEVKISSIPDESRGYIPFARVEHCKFIIADSSAFWLGTSNAEKSYFYTSRNAGVLIQNRYLSRQLIRKFDLGWNGPYAERYDPQKKYLPRKRDGE